MAGEEGFCGAVGGQRSSRLWQVWQKSQQSGAVMERVLSWTQWSVVWDGWVSFNHRCGQWRRTKVTETDGRDNLASPHKTPCHHHAVALFTDPAATYVTGKHSPEAELKNTTLSFGRGKQAHPFGELVSKYLPAQIEPSARWTGPLSGNTLDSLVWRKGCRVGRRHTQPKHRHSTRFSAMTMVFYCD